MSQAAGAAVDRLEPVDHTVEGTQPGESGLQWPESVEPEGSALDLVPRRGERVEVILDAFVVPVPDEVGGSTGQSGPSSGRFDALRVQRPPTFGERVEDVRAIYTAEVTREVTGPGAEPARESLAEALIAAERLPAGAAEALTAAARAAFVDGLHAVIVAAIVLTAAGGLLAASVIGGGRTGEGAPGGEDEPGPRRRAGQQGRGWV